ncbi:MAG: OmpH family outer membrane protein [Prevotella sp.]|nr:OmpH family outer membrane protein [Prevotella sp.]
MRKMIICAICAICGLTASAQSQPKFGHVNTQEIIQAMPEFTAARTEIEKLTEQYQADLKSMQDELQKKAEAFEKEEATLPENIKTRRNQELQDLYQRIQQTYQDNDQALAKAQQEKMQAITAKVLEAIKTLGQEGGYVYIMEMGAGIPYISTTLSTDLTAQVKAKLGLK